MRGTGKIARAFAAALSGMTHEETLALMGVMDEVGGRIGLVYRAGSKSKG